MHSWPVATSDYKNRPAFTDLQIQACKTIIALDTYWRQVGFGGTDLTSALVARPRGVKRPAGGSVVVVVLVVVVVVLGVRSRAAGQRVAPHLGLTQQKRM